MSQQAGMLGEGDEASSSDLVLRSHDLANLAGTTPRALRHYHAIGLLPDVPRDANGYRRYSVDDLVTLLRIRQLAASGVPLRKIAGILDQDDLNQAELFARLDRELEEHVERIEAQRRTLAQLSKLALRPGRYSDSAHPTRTQRLDQDVWTLLTTSGEVDADTAETVLDALDSTALAEQGAWYQEFERLEGHTRIDAASATRLAHRIAEFAHAVWEAAGRAPAGDGPPIMAMVEQMQAQTLSPAQQDVWARFLSIIGRRQRGVGR
ncbi:MerR family transcriptional regulator [Ruania halotolerans]|uniref:helix-turn-helix domain-containing protein n=1 Tax=Ruania halotolerans TaxID=2897773 RepID=UPI001E5CFCA9|nr:MerR family transcriptional regulator [Ruania halotolerans]UFU07313.1 MerR family transcriptional regulator [Ruania halotolerans]